MSLPPVLFSFDDDGTVTACIKEFRAVLRAGLRAINEWAQPAPDRPVRPASVTVISTRRRRDGR